MGCRIRPLLPAISEGVAARLDLQVNASIAALR
ncbi:hypothetical protein LMG24076_00624 [Trinickia soli]|nr:hypothetical protein LMG24076_00624 [Trinickia soli]